MVAGISGKEDLFTNGSVALIFKNALHAAADNADIFSHQEIFQEFIRKTLTALTDDPGSKVFSDDMVAVVLQNALNTLSTHADMVIDVDNPQKQLLADTVRGLAAILARDPVVSHIYQNFRRPHRMGMERTASKGTEGR